MPFTAALVGEIEDSALSLGTNWDAIYQFHSGCDWIHTRRGCVLYFSVWSLFLADDNLDCHAYVGVTEHYMLDEISRELGMPLIEFKRQLQ